jgi:hypothetical protein
MRRLSACLLFSLGVLVAGCGGATIPPGTGIEVTLTDATSTCPHRVVISAVSGIGICPLASLDLSVLDAAGDEVIKVQTPPSGLLRLDLPPGSYHLGIPSKSLQISPSALTVTTHRYTPVTVTAPPPPTASPPTPSSMPIASSYPCCKSTP